MIWAQQTRVSTTNWKN